MSKPIVQHRLISDEEAALLASEMVNPEVINLEGVELRIGTMPDKSTAIVAFAVTGKCATVEIPFAGVSASI
jgi:hypothetical protein